jgi:hypothetical protein
MAQIQMTEALSAALIARMQGEYGQQALSNFALDILLDTANTEIARLLADSARKDETLVTQKEQIQAMRAELEVFRQANDPHRREVMGAADEVKQRRTDRINGSNPHKQ